MFKLLKKAALMCFSLFMVSIYAPTAHAENMVNLGGSGVWISSPYKSHDDLMIPFPMIHWEAKHVYVRGFSAGVFLWTDDYEMNELSIGLAIGDVAFSNKDTNSSQLSRLRDRDRTIDAYLQYIIRTQWGELGARFSHDTLGNADGFLASAFYKIPIHLGTMTITPGVGIQWDTQDRLNHFYGVSRAESNRSGLNSYAPDSGISPFISLEAKLVINESWNIFGAANMRFLSDEIINSPMVDDSDILFATFGVTYSF